MKQQIVAGIVGLSMVGGVGTGVAVHQMRSGSDGSDVKDVASTTHPTTTPTKKPTTQATATKGTGVSPKTTSPANLPTVPVTSLRITAGAVGPVSVGMSKSAAYATGYFRADVAVPACDRVDDLVWKPGYSGALDVVTQDDGSVASIGIRAAGPRTRSGLGVGTTYDTIEGALGGVTPVEAGYGQTGVFVHEGTGWIGFLFNTTPGAIKSSTKVTFIEVSRGDKPGLMRDGC